MSKPMVASFCREVFGIELSVGEICQIEQTVTQTVAPAVEEAAVYVQSCDLNLDETPWKERWVLRGGARKQTFEAKGGG
jgi:hypothetical protein